MNVDKLMAILPMIKNKNWWLGTLLVLALALISDQLSGLPVLKSLGLSTLSIAIILGIIIGNTLFTKIATHTNIGVDYSKNILLRLGIILYGFRVTFQQIADIGIPAIIIAILFVVCTFFLTLQIGTKLLKMDRETTILIGAGSSICGAAAIMAAEPVLKARAEQITVAVATVVVFGTLAIFIYPLLHSLNLHWQLLDTTDFAYGMFVGSTIHEVAQVVAAGAAISPTAADTAVIAKMVRVMMLAPFLIGLAVYLARAKTEQVTEKAPAKKGLLAGVSVPWFAFIFVAVAGFNSLQLLPELVIEHIAQVDTALLAMAMAGLGLTTDLKAIRRAGLKPLMLASLLFTWLVVGGAGLNYAITAAFA